MKLDLNSNEATVVRMALQDFMTKLKTVSHPSDPTRQVELLEADFMEQVSDGRKKAYLDAKGLVAHIKKNQF